MALASLLHHVPLALDGESVTSGNTGIAVISVVSIAFGYIFLAALWYFVFRDRSRGRDDGDSTD